MPCSKNGRRCLKYRRWRLASLKRIGIRDEKLRRHRQLAMLCAFSSLLLEVCTTDVIVRNLVGQLREKLF